MKYAVFFLIFSIISFSSNGQNERMASLTIKGKVVEQKSLLPVRKAKITVRNTDSNIVIYNTRTDDNGEFSFPVNRLMNFSIEAEKFLYETSSTQYNLAELSRLKGYALPDILLKSAL